MRIAVCSNLFPPLWIGGYETGAAEVVRELQRRGHEVLVLTASRAWIGEGGRFECRQQPGSNFVDVGPCILGSLARLSAWRIPSLLLQAFRARPRYRSALKTFAPDLVLLFNPLGLLAPVPADLLRWGRKHRVPVRFYVSDSWLAEWPAAHPLLRLLHRFPSPWLRRLLTIGTGLLGLGSPTPPEPDQAIFCSRYLRDVTDQTEDRARDVPQVIPWGVANLDRCNPLPARHFYACQPLSLVYAGQVQPHKGLDLLLQALTSCRCRHRLVVVGDDRTEYAARCRQLARQLALDRQVEWIGPCIPGELPQLLPRLGQVLVVPSRWQEPFSRVILEGHASGLPVVASSTGGTPEAIRHGLTGFLFNPDQPRELTAVLDRLETDRRLAWQVGQRGQDQARQQFSIERMVDRLLVINDLSFRVRSETGERETINQHAATYRRKDSSRARRVQSPAGRR